MSPIFDIKRFAINDGPGIRTTIFMKGCPLHCVWCHNPEGIASEPEKLYTKKKCIGCQSCVDACPHHLLRLTPDGIDGYQRTSASGKECLLCGACTSSCPTLALEMAGREYTMDQLMKIVEKERNVMEESRGGVTICGGEPLMHPDYLLQILHELGSRDIHRTVDTTLYASDTTVRTIADQCELFLVDLKHMDDARHQLYTGVSNQPILRNIETISRMGHPYWIRIPLIVGVNADDANIESSARFLASLPSPPEVVNVLVYHDIGKGKHARKGTTYNPDEIKMLPPTESEQQHALDILKSFGLNSKIGG